MLSVNGPNLPRWKPTHSSTPRGSSRMPGGSWGMRMPSRPATTRNPINQRAKRTEVSRRHSGGNGSSRRSAPTRRSGWTLATLSLAEDAGQAPEERLAIELAAMDGDNRPPPVDEEGGGERVHAQVGPRHLAGGVERDGEGEAEFAGPGFDLVGAFLHVDREHDQARAAQPIARRLELRHLGAARAAPRRPE